MIEKRSFPRLPRDWEIEYQISKTGPVESNPIKGDIRDLGEGGFSFSSDSVCPPEVLIQFAIKPTDSFKPIVGVARIVWARGQESFYENGAQFVWVSWKGQDAQAAIAHYVVEHVSVNTI
jgi:hypothetical protein